MGMSASQVRFLSLQNRKNTIGRELSTLSNRKMALSRDMQNVSRKYTDALNKTNYKFSYDGGATYNDLTYATLMTPNQLNSSYPYIITDAATGKVVLNNDQIKDFDGNLIYGLDGQPLTYVKLAQSYISSNGAANPESYVVPASMTDFTITSSNRMELFAELGIISDTSLSQYDEAITALYGGPEYLVSHAYPLGTAMGDLYFAEQNLAAFKAMKGKEYRTTFATNQYTNSETFVYNNEANFDISYNYNSQKTSISQNLVSHANNSQSTHMNLSCTETAATLTSHHDDYTFTLITEDGFTMRVITDSTGVRYEYDVKGYGADGSVTITNNGDGTQTVTHNMWYNSNNNGSYTGFDRHKEQAGYCSSSGSRHDLFKNHFKPNMKAAKTKVDTMIDAAALNLKSFTGITLDDGILTRAINKVKATYTPINLHSSQINYNSTSYDDGDDFFLATNNDYYSWAWSSCQNCNSLMDGYIGIYGLCFMNDAGTGYPDDHTIRVSRVNQSTLIKLLKCAYADMANGTSYYDEFLKNYYTAQSEAGYNGIYYSDKSWKGDGSGDDDWTGIHSIAQLNTAIANNGLEFKFNLKDSDVSIIESELQEKYDEAHTRVISLQEQAACAFSSFEQKQMDFYDALFSKIAQSGWMVDDNTSASSEGSTQYLNNKFQNNNFYIAEPNFYEGQAGYKFTTKLASNVVKIFSVHDASAENAALAEYEAQKNLIHSKEQRIDNRMQKLETEQTAINTSMESIKKIIEDNIGSTFKIFS